MYGNVPYLIVHKTKKRETKKEKGQEEEKEAVQSLTRLPFEYSFNV